MSRVEKQVIILNKKGFCLRACVAFIDIAQKFKSTVIVIKDKEQVNGKSAMALWVLGAQYQTPLRLVVEGEDAQEAMNAFEDFFTKQATQYYSDKHFAKYLLGLILLLSLSYFFASFEVGPGPRFKSFFFQNFLWLLGIYLFARLIVYFSTKKIS